MTPAIQLVLKACLLAGLVAVVQGFILFSTLGREVTKQTYYDAWHVKNRLLAGPGQNRIILAGGSNSAFGVDSSKLQAVTHRETINLGLHAGLGLAFVLHEVEDGAREGDLVILIPEYGHFYGDLLNGGLAAAELVQRDRSALRYFSSWRQWRNLVKYSQVATSVAAFALINQAKMALLRRDDPGRGGLGVYTSRAFDAHGDMVGHLDQESKPDYVAAGFKRINGKFNRKAIDAIARSAEILTTRGAEFVVIYPAVAAGYWAVNHHVADEVAAGLPSRWVLTKPEDWVFEDRLFYDTPYHLNRSGRDARTERLVGVLQARTTEGR